MTYTTEIYIKKKKSKITTACKAAGIDEFAGRFLRDFSWVLSKPISELSNISIKLGSFLNTCKIEKLKPFFKKGPKLTPQLPLLPLISTIIEKILND